MTLSSRGPSPSDDPTMEVVIDDALYRGLTGEQTVVPYVVEPHHSELMPGIDAAGFNALLDELDEEAWLQEHRRRADS